MIEVPEHLLKASADARARLTGQGGDDTSAPSEAPAAATTPAVRVASTPAVPVPPKPPAPLAPYVQAGLRRKTVPVWIIPVLLFLPIWAIYYVGYLENPPAEAAGLLFEGEEVYGVSCAGCHGGGGGGGTGRQLNGGEVLLTFPSYEADQANYDGLAGQLHWVANGTAGTPGTYGDPGRGDGVRRSDSFGGAQMAGFAGSLSAEELVAVVYSERAVFGELDDESATAELHLFEEVLSVMEEEGVGFEGASLEEVQHWVDTARAHLSAEESETAAG